MFDHYHGLAHIAIRTLDVEKSIEFYEKIGGKVVLADILGTDRGDKLMAMVEFAGITIELIQVFDPVEPGIIPHFAIYVDKIGTWVYNDHRRRQDLNGYANYTII